MEFVFHVRYYLQIKEDYVLIRFEEVAGVASLDELLQEEGNNMNMYVSGTEAICQHIASVTQHIKRYQGDT